MTRPGWVVLASVLMLGGFTCPDRDRLRSIKIILPSAGRPAHYYDEVDENGLLVLMRAVFVRGDTSFLGVVGRNGYRNSLLAVPGAVLTSSQPSVASITPEGHLVAREVGETVIRTTHQMFADTVRLAVVPVVAQLRLVITPASIRVGERATLAAIAVDSTGAVLPKAYVNFNTDNQSVVGMGRSHATIFGRGVGTTMIAGYLVGQDFIVRAPITVVP